MQPLLPDIICGLFSACLFLNLNKFHMMEDPFFFYCYFNCAQHCQPILHLSSMDSDIFWIMRVQAGSDTP